MKFIKELLSSDEVAADSVVFCCLVAVFGLIGMQIGQMIHHPDLFNPISFGTAAAAIIAAGGAVKTARERFRKDDEQPPH